MFDPDQIRAFHSASNGSPLSPEVETLGHSVIGAAIEVHKEIGPGYMESVYEEAMGIELELRGIAHVRQAPISAYYKGRRVGEGRIDILVDHCIVIELKTVETLAPIHTAQILSYLKATKHRLGLLINFNVPLLKNGIKRIIH